MNLTDKIRKCTDGVTNNPDQGRELESLVNWMKNNENCRY